MTEILWLLPVLVPLVGAAVTVVMRWRRSVLVALCTLPGLIMAITGPPARGPELTWLLLDVTVALDPLGRALLAMTAAVWFVAAVHGRALTAESGRFASLFLLTFMGNIGALLAADVVSFYASFALLSFAAYGLVVHDRSPFAIRAGSVYLVLAIVAEGLLLAGLAMAVAHAGGTAVADVAPALASAKHRGLVIVLLVAGFGVKAGVVPVHVWLPLAHPAAPVAASAVLSGALIKVGMVGWLRILPFGEIGRSDWATSMIVVGLVGIVWGVVAGMLQTDAKTVLAYSSISQIGFLATGVGAGLAAPGLASQAAGATTLYAVHHGATKATLFLGVGLYAATRRSRGRSAVLTGMALAAASLAGLPLTGGWMAKSGLKDLVGLAEQAGAGAALPVGTLLSLGAAGTVVLMTRLLALLTASTGTGTVDRVTGTAYTVLALGGVAAGWVAVPATFGTAWPASPTVGSLWDGTWPVLVGVAGAGVALRRQQPRPDASPAIPAGDLVVLGERAAAVTGRAVHVVSGRLDELQSRARRAGVRLGDLARPGAGLDAVDERVTRWRVAGALFVGLAGALVVMFVGFGN